jgi:threonine dehydrogenase-like Zn-dependent dehydrogenase
LPPCASFSCLTSLSQAWEETDVDIQIHACGICASDLHTASSGWGEVQYPIVVGHEVRHSEPANQFGNPWLTFTTLQIVGKAVRVGSDVKHIKVGDMVGVGAQCGSCLDCPPCKSDKEPYCDLGTVPADLCHPASRPAHRFHPRPPSFRPHLPPTF